jgi:hypothetical protein
MMVIVPVVALICTGLAAGILLGHRAGVSRAEPILKTPLQRRQDKHEYPRPKQTLAREGAGRHR